MGAPTPPLPTVADYAAIDGGTPTAEKAVHQQVVDHVLGSLRDAELAGGGVKHRVLAAMSGAAGEIEDRLLEHYGRYPEVLARVLTTHLIDDYMAATRRTRR